MQTRQRPQSLSLRKVAGSRGTDIGNLHVIDYWLWHATNSTAFIKVFADRQIGRYLDGEEEREGTYR